MKLVFAIIISLIVGAVSGGYFTFQFTREQAVLTSTYANEVGNAAKYIPVYNALEANEYSKAEEILEFNLNKTKETLEKCYTDLCKSTGLPLVQDGLDRLENAGF